MFVTGEEELAASYKHEAMTHPSEVKEGFGREKDIGKEKESGILSLKIRFKGKV